MFHSQSRYGAWWHLRHHPDSDRRLHASSREYPHPATESQECPRNLVAYPDRGLDHRHFLAPAGDHDEGLEIFDSALTGCMTVISCIEFELERLVNNDSMNWATAFKYLWSEDNVKDLLQHSGGQRGALQLLVQSLEV